VSVSVHTSERSRHLVLRVSSGEPLPDALAAKLRDEQVACGWLRASGVVADVELRAFDAELGALGSTRRIAGPVQVLSLEGSIGMVDGEPSFAMRALLAREGERGLETFAGEIASARAVGLEAIVTALDDVALERELDERAGVWLLGAAAAGGGAIAPRPVRSMMSANLGAPAAKPAPTASPAWSSALEASDAPPEARQRYRPADSPAHTANAPMPQRPQRAPVTGDDAPVPEPGDSVDHFAFGRADVVKSDGDRLHLKVHKDGRIREIALEMLRVTPMPDADDGRRRFKLERRM
jgi:predicted DNA-binding protein with PD1-like motif